MWDELQTSNAFRFDSASAQDDYGDPLSDLMFTMIAIVLLALIALLPQILARQTETSHVRHRPHVLAASYPIDGVDAVPMVASSRGVRVSGATTAVGIDEILGNPDIVAFLTALKSKKQRLIVAVDPDGSEAAFQLEGVLARAAPQPIFEMRSADGCFSFQTDAAAPAACAAAEGAP
jgi:hypothetical protein